MICKNCHVSHMLTHPEKPLADQRWLKCGLCGYSEQTESIEVPEKTQKERDLDSMNFLDKQPKRSLK